MQIKDKVIKLEKIDWNLLHDLQDPDFKEAKHKERVKQSIIDNGIASAVDVWLDTTDNKIYIVDGHTRKDALQELHSEGYSIDSTLPCLFLDLQDKAEAAKVLLAFNAKTAKINQDALPSFLETYEITLEEAGIEIEELHLTTFDDISMLDAEADMPELATGDKEPFQQITFTLADDQANFIKEKISEIKKTDAFNYIETFGNQNSNGNALYTIFQEWDRLNK